MAQPRRYRVTGQMMSVEAMKRLRAETPTEALDLSDDIRSIDTAMKLIQSIEPSSITVEREFGRTMQRVTLSQMRLWKQYAQLKLRRDYLAP